MNGSASNNNTRGLRANGVRKSVLATSLSQKGLQGNQLAPFKWRPTITVEDLLYFKKSNLSSSCSTCIPESKALFADDPLSTLGMANMLRVPTQNRDKNLVTRIFYYVSFVMSRKTNTNYANVTQAVVRSKKVSEAIGLAVEEDLVDMKRNYPLPDENKTAQLLGKKHRQRANGLFQRMKSCISAGLLRLAGWVLYKLLSRMLTTIQYSKGQLSTLRRIRENTNVPIIYLPIHRSHLDYILVSFILYMNNIKPPLVAAGDNLNIPFFGNLMRGLGAFFIKRKLDPAPGKKDHVYRAVLDAYMAENLKKGESLEFFLEGGRSRSGKACLPKAGLLSIVVNSLLDNQFENAYIVPVAISYEKLIDGNFVSEQLGKAKVEESFSLAAKAIWSTLRSNFGSVRVDFCKPFSLKEYVQQAAIDANYSYPTNYMLSAHETMHKTDKHCEASKRCAACSANSPGLRTVSSSASIYGIDMTNTTPDNIRTTIQALGEHIIYDASNNTSLMSTQLLSFLLLTKFRKGATLRQLVPAMNWLRDEVERRGRKLGFSGESGEVVRYASNLLGRGLVSTEVMQMAWSSSGESSEDSASRVKKIILLKPSLKLQATLELQYYSNNVIPVFLMDSIIASAFYAHSGNELDNQDPSSDAKITVNREDLRKLVVDLCNTFKYEFIISKPCQNVEDSFSRTIDDMISNGLLSSKVVKSTVKGKSLAFEDDEDDDGYNDDTRGSSEELSFNITEENLETLRFYRSILGPFIESYWLASTHLLTLVKRQREFKVFLNEVLDMSKEKLRQGLLCYQESVSSDQLKNALTLFEHWKIIERKTEAGVTVAYLTHRFDNEDALHDVILKIEKFKM